MNKTNIATGTKSELLKIFLRLFDVPRGLAVAKHFILTKMGAVLVSMSSSTSERW
jgi:hypothetical protein